MTKWVSACSTELLVFVLNYSNEGIDRIGDLKTVIVKIG